MKESFSSNKSRGIEMSQKSPFIKAKQTSIYGGLIQVWETKLPISLTFLS